MATTRFRGKIAHEAGSSAGDGVIKSQLDTGVSDAKNLANATGKTPGTDPDAYVGGFNTAVAAAIASVIAAAPGALDTLDELAAALGDDANFAATIATQQATQNGRLTALEALPVGKRTAIFTKGDGAATSFNCDHSWALADKYKVQVQVVETTDDAVVYPNIVVSTVNRVIVDFGTFVPASNTVRVTIMEI